MGVPTVTIVTDQFVTLARGTQKSQGLTDMCFVTVPHPIGMLPKEQVDAKVDAAFGDIVKAATQWQPVKEKEAAQESPYPAKTFKFTGTYADVNKLFAKRKWSLSLPIIPPTVDRVREMLKGTKHAPSEVLWVVPPRQGMLTVELVAVLGVMAGAQPEHMPLLLATIDAMKAPEAAWRGTSTTTAPTSPLIVISGPIVEKLKLNDASLSFEPESSVALGFGFRCGFLGMLHMEIIQERLEREFDLDLITTLPSVIYRITKTDGTVLMIDNPHDYPNPASIEVAEEPFVNVSIITPQEFVGNIMPLCQDLRGEYKNMQYLDSRLVELHYEMPLNEIVYNFFDTLKARTKGYASLDYEFSSYHPSELVKVDMLLNGDQVDALSFIAHKDKAYGRARKLCEKLKENIPRQLFEIPVQAAIGGKIIARETVKALRKDVLAKCYGGDITRKKKLLEKQKEGKKKMRQLGTVQIPTEAFLAVLKLDE